MTSNKQQGVGNVLKPRTLLQQAWIALSAKILDTIIAICMYILELDISRVSHYSFLLS